MKIIVYLTTGIPRVPLYLADASRRMKKPLSFSLVNQRGKTAVSTVSIAKVSADLLADRAVYIVTANDEEVYTQVLPKDLGKHDSTTITFSGTGSVSGPSPFAPAAPHQASSSAPAVHPEPAPAPEAHTTQPRRWQARPAASAVAPVVEAERPSTEEAPLSEEAAPVEDSSEAAEESGEPAEESGEPVEESWEPVEETGEAPVAPAVDTRKLAIYAGILAVLLVLAGLVWAVSSSPAREVLSDPTIASAGTDVKSAYARGEPSTPLARTLFWGVVSVVALVGADRFLNRQLGDWWTALIASGLYALSSVDFKPTEDYSTAFLQLVFMSVAFFILFLASVLQGVDLSIVGLFSVVNAWTLSRFGLGGHLLRIFSPDTTDISVMGLNALNKLGASMQVDRAPTNLFIGWLVVALLVFLIEVFGWFRKKKDRSLDQLIVSLGGSVAYVVLFLGLTFLYPAFVWGIVLILSLVALVAVLFLVVPDFIDMKEVTPDMRLKSSYLDAAAIGTVASLLLTFAFLA